MANCILKRLSNAVHLTRVCNISDISSFDDPFILISHVPGKQEIVNALVAPCRSFLLKVRVFELIYEVQKDCDSYIFFFEIPTLHTLEARVTNCRSDAQIKCIPFLISCCLITAFLIAIVTFPLNTYMGRPCRILQVRLLK